jgi:3-hydroxyacyl-CoA dehydrogenase
VGLKKVLERIREFQRRLGNWWEPAPLLQRLADQGKTFAEFSNRLGAAA